jgi:hypothetical protein
MLKIATDVFARLRRRGRCPPPTVYRPSLFTDDDKTEHLKWEWALEIRKDWA